MHQLTHNHQGGYEIRTLGQPLASGWHSRRYLRQLVERLLDFIDAQLPDRLLRVAQHLRQGGKRGIGTFQYLQRILAQGRNPGHEGILDTGDGLFHCLLRRRKTLQSRLQQR